MPSQYGRLSRPQMIVHPTHPPVQTNKNVGYNVTSDYFSTKPISKARKEKSPGIQNEDKTQTRVVDKT